MYNNNNNDGDILTVLLTLLPIVCFIVSSFISDLRDGTAFDMQLVIDIKYILNILKDVLYCNMQKGVKVTNSK